MSGGLVYVNFTVADEEGPFATPEIALSMPVSVTYGADYKVTAQTHYGPWPDTGEPRAEWSATADTRVQALIKLVAARCGEGS